ncbi:MAG: response regulator transcription factor [Halothiobacillus sp.]
MKHSETVFVVDDDPGIRDSLSLLLEQQDITVKVFDSASDFLAVIGQPEPRSCAIIDIRMPDMNGLELQAELTQRSVSLPIIFLTGHGDIPMSVRAIKGGAINFLTKPITSHTLLESVYVALLESDRLNSQLEVNHSAQACLQLLTEREREVMVLTIEGQTNKDIGRRLGISHRTVEIHRSHVMHKTGAKTLPDLIRIAAEAGNSAQH